MHNLNPTLWRTCRMLAGQTRIRLLRELEKHPGRNVTTLAAVVGIGVSDASQELRRIQSRGLLQAVHHHANLIYRFGADPQVSSAAPLLKALRITLANDDPATDREIQAMAHALAHPTRTQILKALMAEPMTAYALHQSIRVSFAGILRHIKPLIAGGYIHRDRQALRFAPPGHTLARALVKLLPP